MTDRVAEFREWLLNNVSGTYWPDDLNNVAAKAAEVFGGAGGEAAPISRERLLAAGFRECEGVGHPRYVMASGEPYHHCITVEQLTALDERPWILDGYGSGRTSVKLRPTTMGEIIAALRILVPPAPPVAGEGNASAASEGEG